VNPAAIRLIDAIRTAENVDEVTTSILEGTTAGDPAEAARAFADAARDPNLCECLEAWVPSLITSARPAPGARALAALVAQRRELGSPLDVRSVPALPAVLGASGFLTRRLAAHPEWIDEIAGEPPPPPDPQPIDADWDEIRRAKYRGLLRIAARDLGDRPFEASLSELSDLADRCLVAGLGCVTAETGGMPPALLALGKLGGRELNFSSDVDVLFLYQPAPGTDPHDEAERTARFVRRFKSNLEAPVEEGFGYRVDLDLRPEGPAGVLANPTEAALAYYESFGAEWERQMLLRLRAIGGPVAVSDAFAAGIEPFVYRRTIGPDVMRHVRDMKHRIEAERRDAGREPEWCLKEGPGGIRDVEFLVQAFQLLHAGHRPSLRTGNVLTALRELDALGLLPESIVASLRDAYLWLRRAEHALQLAEEQQTSRVPRDAVGQVGLARRMGYASEEAAAARSDFNDDWASVRNEVRAHFDALVLGEAE